MRDTVVYEMPLGPLGLLVHALVVRRMLAGIFAYRETALHAIFPAAGDRSGS